MNQLQIISNSTIENSPNYLHWKQRPDYIKKAIQLAFSSIESSTSSKWNLYNGSSTYGLCGIADQSLVNKIIADSISTKKEIYLLDIGAGNFQWGKAISLRINIALQAGEIEVPVDFKVYIISIRGERNQGVEITQEGICTHYQLGSILVEELELEEKDTHLKKRLKNLGLELNTSCMDLIVSSWCLRHLVDPVGTFVQIYNLIRPESGLLLFDGFFFNNAHQAPNEGGDENMIRLVSATHSQFVMRSDGDSRSFNEICLRRVGSTPCELPMHYLGMTSNLWNYEVGSGCVTQFQWNFEPLQVPFLTKHSYGDSSLNNWLIENKLFTDKKLYKLLSGKILDV